MTLKDAAKSHRIRTNWRSFRTGGRNHEQTYYTCEECGRSVVLMFIDPHGAAKSYYRHLPTGVDR